MPNRVTGAEVKEICDTTKTATQVEEFITPANLVVTDVTADASYSAALLKEIERWYAAHLVSCDDPQIKSETFGGGAGAYQGQTGMGLNYTTYGQQVLVMDYKGYFAELQQGKRPAVVKAII